MNIAEKWGISEHLLNNVTEMRPIIIYNMRRCQSAENKSRSLKQLICVPHDRKDWYFVVTIAGNISLRRIRLVVYIGAYGFCIELYKTGFRYEIVVAICRRSGKYTNNNRVYIRVFY